MPIQIILVKDGELNLNDKIDRFSSYLPKQDAESFEYISRFIKKEQIDTVYNDGSRRSTQVISIIQKNQKQTMNSVSRPDYLKVNLDTIKKTTVFQQMNNIRLLIQEIVTRASGTVLLLAHGFFINQLAYYLFQMQSQKDSRSWNFYNGQYGIIKAVYTSSDEQLSQMSLKKLRSPEDPASQNQSQMSSSKLYKTSTSEAVSTSSVLLCQYRPVVPIRVQYKLEQQQKAQELKNVIMEQKKHQKSQIPAQELRSLKFMVQPEKVLQKPVSPVRPQSSNKAIRPFVPSRIYYQTEDHRVSLPGKPRTAPGSNRVSTSDSTRFYTRVQ